ncbi:hypothetical protein [Christiangramia sp. LLG6405-1]|uniref:hypothetical protein n=1 Tax=Christiangramia sp. LLG6405-1 TaxID=3160832 RepID=UPI00386B7B67
MKYDTRKHMLYKYLGAVLIIFLFSVNLKAQETSLLKGQIISENKDVQNVHIVNLTQETGTTSDVKGEFFIGAAINDSLFISSVQFQNRTVVVRQNMIESGKIEIELYEAMNELSEVFIDDIELSGYLANDLNLISIKEVETKNRLQQNLDDFIRKDRELNPYYQPSMTEGIRIDKIAMAIAEKLSKNKETPIVYSPKELANLSLKIVGEEFFSKDLDLDANEICNFLLYCDRDQNFEELVLNNNALVLIEYFETRIESFRKLRAGNLNAGRQLPG